MIKLLKRIATNHEVFLFGLVSIFYYFTAVKKEIFTDSDEAWHIATGFLIRKLGHIPAKDPWSFSSDQEWYNLSWVWDILSSYIYQVVGDNFIFVSVFLYSLLVVCIYRFLKGLGNLKDDTVNIVTAINAVLIYEVYLFRPQVFAYFLTLFCVSLFYKAKHNFDRPFALKFALLIIAWVNLHGSVMVAFFICGAYFIEALSKKNWQNSVALFLIGTVGFCCIFVNPVGYKYFIGMFRTLDSIITSRIVEWQPITFGVYFGYTFCLAIFVLITNINHKKIPLSDKIITYAWLFSSLITIRTFPFFLILSLNYWARCIDGLIKPSKITVFTPARYVPTLIICFLLFLNYHTIKPHHFPYEDNARVPRQEIDFLVKNYPGIRVLNEYTAGGFILFYGEGKISHFIDPRAGTVFSEDVLWEYINYADSQPGWEDIIGKYNIQAVLLTKSQYTWRKDIAHVFRGWVNVFAGSYGYILVSPELVKKKS
jgi:hypothetical protein